MKPIIDRTTSRAELELIVHALCIDPVFNVFTRSAFQQVIFPKIKHLIKALIFADIDNLHNLNRTFGYAVIDQKIKRSLETRRADIVLRWYSGDEIVWVIFDGDKDKVVNRIEAQMFKEGLSAKFSSRYTKGVTNWKNLEELVQDMAGDVAQQKLLRKREFSQIFDTSNNNPSLM